MLWDIIIDSWIVWTEPELSPTLAVYLMQMCWRHHLYHLQPDRQTGVVTSIWTIGTEEHLSTSFKKKSLYQQIVCLWERERETSWNYSCSDFLLWLKLLCWLLVRCDDFSVKPSVISPGNFHCVLWLVTKIWNKAALSSNFSLSRQHNPPGIQCCQSGLWNFRRTVAIVRKQQRDHYDLTQWSYIKMTTQW